MWIACALVPYQMTLAVKALALCACNDTVQAMHPFTRDFKHYLTEQRSAGQGVHRVREEDRTRQQAGLREALMMCRSAHAL